MSAWPKQPVIYEINTWVWLNDLGRRYRRPLTLQTIPSEEWDAFSGLGIDAVWLMGIWERSPAGLRIARQLHNLKTAYRAALPDYSDADVIGSPYSIRRYRVDEHLGGSEGLAKARGELSKRGIRLILDFVPNHLARDHFWIRDHPSFFIQGDESDLHQHPDDFFKANGKIFACGKDPYLPSWTDTVQLNAFNPQMRASAIEVLRSISRQCDGVRCDMAMLVINEVFENSWGIRAGQPPETEYWCDVISAVRRSHPDFLFLAEAYWDRERELHRQGFDYCYDKCLYDRLMGGSAEDVRLYLRADVVYQKKLIRFLENHDEPRAADVFPFEKLSAAAFAVSLLPGAKLIYEGQFEGRRVKLPVQLGRRRAEKTNHEAMIFYSRLMKIVQKAQLQNAEWRLCERTGWSDNESCLNIIAWSWGKHEERYLAALNFSNFQSQARIPFPWLDFPKGTLQLVDLFSGAVYQREGRELLDPGLYVDLPPWGFHFLECRIPG
jgi:glycosidase